jgi:uncharacterized protein YkwD
MGLLGRVAASVPAYEKDLQRPTRPGAQPPNTHAMLQFTMVDAVLGMLILIGLWSGYRRGFLQAGAELATVLASLVFAFVFYQMPVAWLTGQWPPLDAWLPALSFILLFLLATSLIGFVAYKVVRLFPAKVHMHGVNRFLGLAPGAVNGLLHAVIAVLLVLSVPLLDRFSSYAQKGVIGAHLAQPAEQLHAALEPIFAPAVRKVEKALTVPPQSNRTVKLDFRKEHAKPRPDLEARMLDLVNQERARHNLKPVRPDTELVEVARAHSQDMLARGYFSHVSPEGESLPDRMRREKVRYLVAGENLALAPTLAIAHEGLMDSPGHRANILRPQFGHLGVGVLDAGRHGLMVTQNFSN